MDSPSITHHSYTACPDCDLLVSVPDAPAGFSVVCPRCGSILRKKIEGTIAKALALSGAGLLLYGPAITMPLMTFQSFGFSDSANIIESIMNFYRNEYYFVSFMVLLSAVVFPLLLLSGIFFISLMLHRRRQPPILAGIFRLVQHLEDWAMVEVYLLGILITVIKMRDSTDIHFQSGVFCFAFLVLVTLAISTVTDRDEFWRQIGEPYRARWKIPVPVRNSGPESETCAAREGLVLCHICHLLSPEDLSDHCCPRCGARLHRRKRQSYSRTWALILTSAIFLAPANLLPIMRVDFLGIPDRSTILDGIIYFFHNGSYLIGVIIFIASILVPVFKIVGLTIMLVTRPPCNLVLLRQKTRMYRFIAFIGRWSMLDVFVISLLTVLVDFGIFTSIHVAPAATYFCIVVASTMFAAITFDPRIMWDTCLGDDCRAAVAKRSTSS